MVLSDGIKHEPPEFIQQGYECFGAAVDVGVLIRLIDAYKYNI